MSLPSIFTFVLIFPSLLVKSYYLLAHFWWWILFLHFWFALIWVAPIVFQFRPHPNLVSSRFVLGSVWSTSSTFLELRWWNDLAKFISIMHTAAKLTTLDWTEMTCQKKYEILLDSSTFSCIKWFCLLDTHSPHIFQSTRKWRNQLHVRIQRSWFDCSPNWKATINIQHEVSVFDRII